MFLALLDASSFREAGEVLGVNASTVGRRLDGLEAALGTRLFERSRGGVVPTAAAEHLTPAARHFARAASAFSHATSAIETEPAGRVVISAPTGVANRVLVPHISTLIDHHPRLQVVIDTNNAFADLDRQQADLALRSAGVGKGLHGGSTLVARRLMMGASPVVPVASPAYAETLGQLNDLSAARWVTFGERTAGFSWARKVLDHVPSELIALRSDEASTVFAAAEAGIGATFMTRIFTDDRLVEVPLGPSLRHLVDLEEELWLVGHRALRDVPRVQVVWDHLVEALAQPSPVSGC